MKTAVAETETLTTKGGGYGHRNFCPDCKGFQYHDWTLLESGELEKRCQVCGRAVEFVLAGGQWLPEPIYVALAAWLDFRIEEVEKKYEAKVLKEYEDALLADFDAQIADYQEQVVKPKRHVTLTEWMIERLKREGRIK